MLKVRASQNFFWSEILDLSIFISAFDKKVHHDVFSANFNIPQFHTLLILYIRKIASS